MDCKNFEFYGSAYIDNMLSDQEKQKFESHINRCENCSIAFENLKLIVESVNEVEEIELPTNFSSQLNEKLQGAGGPRSKLALFRSNKIFTSVAAAVLIFVLSLSLINNFSNSRKEVEFYSGTDTEERINIHMASEEPEMGAGEDRILKDKNNEGPNISLRMAPADGDRPVADGTPFNNEEASEELPGEVTKEDSG